MGLLTSLARAAAGQVPLSSPLGKLILATAHAVDPLTASGKAYIQTWRISGNQDLALALQLILETTIVAQNISFNPVNGVYTLSPGKAYHLLAHGQLSSYTAPNNGKITIQWVDATFVDSGITYGVPGVFQPSTYNTDTGNDAPVVEAIIVPTVETRVMLGIIGKTGSATLPPQRFTATIVEI